MGSRLGLKLGSGVGLGYGLWLRMGLGLGHRRVWFGWGYHFHAAMAVTDGARAFGRLGFRVKRAANVRFVFPMVGRLRLLVADVRGVLFF